MICASGHTHKSRFEAERCDGLGYAQSKDDVAKLREDLAYSRKKLGETLDKCLERDRRIEVLNLQVVELREALYALLRLATKPQPRDEEEQEQVVAKVAKALKSAGRLDESEDTEKQECEHDWQPVALISHKAMYECAKCRETKVEA